MVSLIAKLKAVEDPRTGNAKFHNLEDILFIAIAAGVAGAEGWCEVADYAESNLEFIRKYATLPYGVSLLTIHLIAFLLFSSLKSWKSIIRNGWLNSFRPGDCISVDGKTIRGAGERGEEGFVHMVSTCHSESDISPGQVKVEQKSNEITGFNCRTNNTENNVLTIQTNLDVTNIFGSVVFEFAEGLTAPKLGEEVYAALGNTFDKTVMLSFRNVSGQLIDLRSVTSLTINGTCRSCCRA